MRALTIAAVLLASAGALAQDEPESSASLDVSVEESAASRGMVTAQRDGLSRRELSLEASLRVAALEFDALLPGHGAIALDDGHAHVDIAAQTIERLAVPANIV